MAQLGEEPKAKTKITMLPSDERPDERRRLHLRDITNETPEASETVGAELRAARLRRGEDLRSIAQSLRIKRDHLEALEEGQYDNLPPRAYAIGFIRSYSEYLGLDPRHVVDRFKQEIDAVEQAAADLIFPKVSDTRRLPRGSAIVIAMIIAAGVYGGWLLSRSADQVIADRVPTLPSSIEQMAGEDANEVSEAASSTPGDTASASTPSASEMTATSSVYAPNPVDQVADDTETYVSPETGNDLSVGSVGAGAVDATLPPLPEGVAYGTENVDGRVTIRARKNDAWLRVEDAHGKVLIERTLQAGDSYRAPGQPGVILVARDASAFELLVDGQSLGLTGPPTLVLTGKPLDAIDLLAAMPKPALAADSVPANAPVSGVQ
ncbi:MAG: DUF4115 domain-containing protein [Rhizobiales bacterium]|nr:DUF4115 domain-containing protein [Hyphomicrobiales bacterium]